MIRTQIYLPEELKQDLHFLAKKEEKSLSEVVRHALQREVKRGYQSSRNVFEKIASHAVDGPGDLSTNLFDYLYGEKSDYATKKRSKR